MVVKSVKQRKGEPGEIPSQNEEING